MAVVLAVVTNAASAEPSDVDGGTILRDYEQLERYQDETLPDLQQRPSRPPLQPGEGVTVKVREIIFSGATELVDIEALRAEVAGALGMELDFEGLRMVANRVTDYLKAQGWFLARAYLPQQDVSDGVVEIVILAGALSESRPVDIVSAADGFDRASPRRVEAITRAALPAGEPVREENVNRAVLLINDLAGMSAQSRLKPGPESGTTTLEMLLSESALASGQFRLDNYGGESTGENRATLSAGLSNLSGIGEQLTLATTQSEGTSLYRADFFVPLTVTGLSLALSTTDLDYDVITEAGKEAGIEGDTLTHTASLSYPVVRSRTHNLNIGLSGRWQHMLDRDLRGEIADTQKNSLTLNVDGSALDTWLGGGRSQVGLGLVLGDLSLDLEESRRQDQQGFQTAGSYAKLTFEVSRLQQVSDPLTVYGRLNTQWAAQNLDSSEKLGLGGLTAVRGVSGAGSGDDAAILQLELRYALPQRLPGNIDLRGKVFFDAGWVRLYKDTYDQPLDTATERNTYGVQGTGIALTATRGDAFSLNAVWGFPLGDNPGRAPDTDSSNASQFWLQAVARF